ncbi:tetratricopeptide repeat protein [Dyadobacter sp. Leaf189]|uniref:tetratricopeptide repeat protein n=1 Tax=Dyadobacter sp. Leaf189 TaxID=1736295 RepID=UPI0006F5C302|nr:tetratricopeptide repeat protein [Dyadobacter sp. Leaf189]KQS33816.1 hypothetical protein ASG33_07145 [Dyadobacter sp. Leaf189]
MENLSQEEINQIQLYVHQLMEAEERKRFELRMQSDPAFAEEVEIRRIAQIYRFTKVKDHLLELRDQMMANGQLSREKEDLPLKEIPLLRPQQDSTPEKETQVVSLWPTRLAAAAVVLIVLGFGAWLWNSQKHTGDNVATDSNEENVINPSAADMVAVFISEASQPRGNVPRKLKKAVGAFENQQTDEAIRLLKNRRLSLLPRKKDEYGAGEKGVQENTDPVLESFRKFYLGVSYLSKGEAARALTYLQEVKNPLRDEARWYTALAHLKNNDPGKARVILQSIKNDSASKFNTEAGQLLNELK